MDNILMFLTPKAQVDFLYEDFTVRQAIEKMEVHKYATIPVIERKTGYYLRSLNYGDFLSYILANRTDFDYLEKIPLSEVKEYREIKPVYVSAEISSLYKVMLEQNYVPVVDDQNVFIGIVTRKNILSHLL